MQQIFAEGKLAHVPLLASCAADKQRGSVIPAKPQPSAGSFKIKADAEFRQHAPEFLKLCPATAEEEALRSAGDLAQDRLISYFRSASQTGKAPVYRYRFILGSPGDDKHLATCEAKPDTQRPRYLFWIRSGDRTGLSNEVLLQRTHSGGL